MSKNKQILLFSGIGLLVLGGVTAALLLTAPEKEPADGTTPVIEEEIDERCYLTDKAIGEVASISVANSHGGYDIIKENDTWTIDGLQKAVISTGTIQTLVQNVSSMTASDFVEENAEDLNKYGLDSTSAKVDVTYTDGTVFSFTIGNEVAADTSKVYFCETGKTTVYTYKKSAVSLFEEEKFAFISVAATPEYDQSSSEIITKLTIDRFDLEEPIVIEALAEPDDGSLAVFSYEMTSPYDAYVDLTNAPNFMYSIFGLEAEKAAWFGMTEEDYEISGLSDPSCVFTVETNVKNYTITLGNAISEEVSDDKGNVAPQVVGFYGMSSEVPDTLFVFSLDSVPAMVVQPDELISRLFLMPYIYSLDKVEYEDSQGTSFEISFEEAGTDENGNTVYKHFLNGEEHDEDHLKNMYQYLISASGEKTYFEEEKGELLAQVTYSYKKAGEAPHVVQFYSCDEDRSVIINVNGENLFKTKQIYITQLYANAKNFLSGGEIVLTY
ncbi:MAG: DUF4340 domain-containing protein [Ruminiclostridium sp.]|nr:DUF4340 domain-containing protein [Ruminiclostridium sp.]